MYKSDVLIIGAGAVGLAIARSLSASESSIIVLERNGSFGQETSSRNSEVIHGGMYYPADSLKAKLCVRGRELLYDFCQRNNVPHKKTGKLIVAVEKEEVAGLERLFKDGAKNGVSGLKMLKGEEAKALEPNVSCIRALHSPETGIVDSHIFMRKLMDQAKANGAMIVFNSEVIVIEKRAGNYRVKVQDVDGGSELSARIVINCAGLDSDLIAEMAGIDIKGCNYDLHYCKGRYFRVSGNKANMIKMLVYPVPKPKSGGLGVHATPDLTGGLRLGPDHEYLNNRVKDYVVDGSLGESFYRSVKMFLPFIEANDISPDTAGIRPKLQPEDGPFRDFVIKEESDKGLGGFVNLIGIESPGLTASLAIAEYVAQILKTASVFTATG